MKIKKTATREPVPAGVFPARCYKLQHFGTVPDTYMGEHKMVNKLRIDWELPTETKVFDPEKGEQPLSISKVLFSWSVITGYIFASTVILKNAGVDNSKPSNTVKLKEYVSVTICRSHSEILKVNPSS